LIPENQELSIHRRPLPLPPKLARFEIVRRLGEGGAGLVYEALDRERNVRVALKMLRAFDGETLLRLKEEFRALQDIEHRNLIRLFELVCDEGTWFFTMELVDGVGFVNSVTRPPEAAGGASAGTAASENTISLHGRPSGEPRFDEDKLRAALHQLATGLTTLHASGKVHCDIKPSNVLVAKEGRVVILDFGLVRDASVGTLFDEDLIVGTIPYMAPEQGAAEDVGPPADWYSVGAVLYQCLTGRRPFEGPGMEVLQRKLVEDPPRPRALAPWVPMDLDALCMDLLDRDPARRPTGAAVLRRLESRSWSHHPSPLAVPPGQSPFVGRAAELGELHASFERVRAGHALTVIVEGESGVGKSAMVRRFTKALQKDRDVLVLAGRCYERESVPYKAIDGVIDSLSNHLTTLAPGVARALLPSTTFALVRAFPVLGRVPLIEDAPAIGFATLQESRALLFGALRELLTNLARAHPLVVVIDDLQWADADSLALLEEILRGPEPPPLLLIATARSRADSATEGDAAPFGLPGDVRVLPLRRLDAAEGLELVRMLADDISPSVAQRIAEEAGGHPLFVDELVRHAQFLGGRAPENVHLDGALVARVSRVDADARLVLELLCVAGAAMPQELLMRAAGLGFTDFAKHAQTLRTAHLARSHGARDEDAIEPFHDRVREAVVGDLDSEARKRAHARIALALESAKTRDPNALSTQWLGAGDLPKAGAYARVAAEQALLALAFERAAFLFERALSMAALSPEETQDLRVKLASALANAGRGSEAARAYFAAASHATPERALDLRRRAAEELLTAGRVDEGNAALRDVLRGVGLRLPRTPLGALLGLLFFRFVLLLRGLKFEERAAAEISAHARTRVDACNGVAAVLSALDTIRGAYFQTRGLLAALALGDAMRLSNALSVEGAYVAAAGPRNGARAAKLIARAGAIAERGVDMESRARVESGAGYAQFFVGRFPEGLARNDRAVQILREHSPGAFWTMRTGQLGAMWCIGWMGNLNELAVRVEQGVREAEHRGDIYSATTLRTGILNLAWLRRGDAGAARAVVLDATRQWTQRGYHSQHYWSLLALTRVELYEGDGRSAHARVEREWSRIARAMILQVRIMGVEATHMRASAALAVATEAHGSERARMIRAAERDARRLAGMGDSLSASFAHLVRGGAQALRGDADTAARELGAAAQGFQEASMALHGAAATWHLGRLRGGEEGRALTASAESWMGVQGIASAARMAGMLAPGFRR